MVRITTNMPALMDWRQSGETCTNASLNMERLKKDLSIKTDENRVKPDASEKMCNQIRGHNQAIYNVQQEITQLQTASGGLNEIRSLLQNIDMLLQAVPEQSSKGDDPITMQKVISDYIGEIDWIAANTQFAGRNLLDGSVNATGKMDSESLAINNINIQDPSLHNQSQQQVDAAIKKVAFEQEKLVEALNSLENNLQNLLTASENLSASESLIRESETALKSLNSVSLQIRMDANLALLAQGNLEQLRTSYLLFNTE